MWAVEGPKIEPVDAEAHSKNRTDLSKTLATLHVITKLFFPSGEARGN